MNKNYYLKIPVGENLGNCDLYLENAMDSVAKFKNYESRKFYISKEFSCSKTETKLMTERKTNPNTTDLPQSKFPTKDAYRKLRRINPVLYAKVIKSFIKDYEKIASLQDRQKLLDYIKDWNLNPKTYEQAFCHPIFNGFKTVESDESTANYINRRSDTSVVYANLIKELFTNQTEIKL
jgi:hypothetical protein